MALPVVKDTVTGTFAALAQIRLNAHGYSITVDGRFGVSSTEATKQFQAAKGLTADGVIGQQTWDALLDEPSIPAPPPEPRPTEPPPAPTPAPEPTRPVLRKGDRSEDVKTLQERLVVHGYSLVADGVFGAGTETAVKLFQTSKSLTSDGVIGQQTWKALLAAPSGSVPVVDYSADARRILPLLGWRVNTDARFWQAVQDFQRMWNLGPALSVDGKVGPKTYEALKISEANKAAGKGDISAHFSANEFDCKCGGKYADCRRIWAHRALVQACEVYRSRVGPFTPISACRCDSHNAAVGGYEFSQHLYGCGVDVVPVISSATMKGLGVASGIGTQRSTGLVRHFDLRHLSPKNYPYATLSAVHIYYYG